MIPDHLTELLRHPDIKTATTQGAPAGQCTWCEMDGTLCAVTITWLPRPDVLSDGLAECCPSCVRTPLRWALDDALTGSVVQVEISAGVTA